MTDEERDGSDHDKLLALIVRHELLAGAVDKGNSLIEGQLLPQIRAMNDREIACATKVQVDGSTNQKEHEVLFTSLRAINERCVAIEDLAKETARAYSGTKSILLYILSPLTAILTGSVMLVIQHFIK